MAPMSILQDLGLDFTKDCEPTDIVIWGVGGKAASCETRALKLWIYNPTSKVWAAEIIYISKGHRVSLLSYDCLLKLKMVTKDTLNSAFNYSSYTASSMPQEKEGLCRST
jgi:hypothetical protein